MNSPINPDRLQQFAGRCSRARGALIVSFLADGFLPRRIRPRRGVRRAEPALPPRPPLSGFLIRIDADSSIIGVYTARTNLAMVSRRLPRLAPRLDVPFASLKVVTATPS